LTFKPIGMVDEATAMQISEVAKSDVIQQIIGLSPVSREEEFASEPLPTIAAPVAQPVVAAPIPQPAPIPVAPVAPVAPAPIPVAVAPIPEPTPIPVAPVAAQVLQAAPPVLEVSGGLESQIADVMAGLDFDD
jgi:fused signal recognition particle receptor